MKKKRRNVDFGCVLMLCLMIIEEFVSKNVKKVSTGIDNLVAVGVVHLGGRAVALVGVVGSHFA